MSKRRNSILFSLILLPLAGSAAADASEKPLASHDVAGILSKAYPDFIKGGDGNSILWQDGTRSPISDGAKDKSFDQLLKNATIADQLQLSYPLGPLLKAPDVNSDPGRFRNEEFFTRMYGDCRKGEVEAKLVPIKWLPKTWGKIVKVTKVNDIASHLSAVSDEIDRLPADIKKAAYPIAGILSCRAVADTGKLSMHAYGAAIDLNLEFSDYWFWQKRSSNLKYKNRMPAQIVEAFERHGFIWGGKWYHFDTMPFEYRPELLRSTGRNVRLD